MLYLLTFPFAQWQSCHCHGDSYIQADMKSSKEEKFRNLQEVVLEGRRVSQKFKKEITGESGWKSSRIDMLEFDIAQVYHFSMQSSVKIKIHRKCSDSLFSSDMTGQVQPLNTSVSRTFKNHLKRGLNSGYYLKTSHWHLLVKLRKY